MATAQPINSAQVFPSSFYHLMQLNTLCLHFPKMRLYLECRTWGVGCSHLDHLTIPQAALEHVHSRNTNSFYATVNLCSFSRNSRNQHKHTRQHIREDLTVVCISNCITRMTSLSITKGRTICLVLKHRCGKNTFVLIVIQVTLIEVILNPECTWEHTKAMSKKASRVHFPKVAPYF
jgi:hypothetical protein